MKNRVMITVGNLKTSSKVHSRLFLEQVKDKPPERLSTEEVGSFIRSAYRYSREITDALGDVYIKQLEDMELLGEVPGRYKIIVNSVNSDDKRLDKMFEGIRFYELTRFRDIYKAHKEELEEFFKLLKLGLGDDTDKLGDLLTKSNMWRVHWPMDWLTLYHAKVHRDYVQHTGLSYDLFHSLEPAKASKMALESSRVVLEDMSSAL